MRVPHNQLSEEALQGVIEEFVTREGTDYGLMDIPLYKKVNQIKKQLDEGKVFLTYDEDSNTCNIIGENT